MDKKKDKVMEQKKVKGEINSGERLVDTAGFISRERRIKNLIRAGKRLEELRKAGAFDVLPGEDEPEHFFAPRQRQKNYDLADLSADQKFVDEKIKGVKIRQKEREEALKASQAVQASQDKASDKKAE